MKLITSLLLTFAYLAIQTYAEEAPEAAVPPPESAVPPPEGSPPPPEGSAPPPEGQAPPPEGTYTTKYDGVNLDEILANERLLNSYVNCLLDVGPCTPDGKELKQNLPDAILNDCQKCSDRQREGADQVMEYIIDHREEDWKKLEEKYNSDGSYKKKYLERKQAKEAPKESSEESGEGENQPQDKTE